MSWKILIVPVLLYLGIVALAYFAQTALLFPTRMVLPAGPPPPSARPLALETPSGHRLHGLHIPPAQGEGRLLLLGFGGNAWDAGSMAEYLHELFPDADVVAFHYRGYGPSGGTPGAEALQQDALLVHDRVAAAIGADRIVPVGFSVGGGVAAHLAAHRPLSGLILVTPFDSLTEVAAGHYPWLPVRLLFRHRMEPARDLAGIRIPVAILAAERDSIVAAPRTDALRRAMPRLAFDRTIPGAGHNDLYQRPEFRQAMREAMDELLARQ
jgi:uncharacterized protein